MEVKRFEDTYESIYDFGTEFLVVCPKCQAMAKVVPLDTDQTDITKRCKLVCPSCGLSKVDRKTMLGWVQFGGDLQRETPRLCRKLRFGVVATADPRVESVDGKQTAPMDQIRQEP